MVCAVESFEKSQILQARVLEPTSVLSGINIKLQYDDVGQCTVEVDF